MIDVRELRIGNIFKTSDCENFRVGEIYKKKMGFPPLKTAYTVMGVCYMGLLRICSQSLLQKSYWQGVE